MNAAPVRNLVDAAWLSRWRSEGVFSDARRIWLARWVVHGFEVLVDWKPEHETTSLSVGLIKALAREPSSIDLGEMALLLGLSSDQMRSLSRSLQRQGHLQVEEETCRATLTATGQQLSRFGEEPIRTRKTLSFLGTTPPLFLRNAASLLEGADRDSDVSVDQVRDLLLGVNAWTTLPGFPSDVLRIHWPTPALETMEVETIPFYRSARPTFLLIETREGRLLGHGVRESEARVDPCPVLDLPSGVAPLSEWIARMPEVSWEPIFRQWCLARAIPLEGVGPRVQEKIGADLRIAIGETERLSIEGWLKSRGHDELWLCAGSAEIQEAVRVTWHD
ncbi:MAG: hypothetical protein ACKO23_06320 [Gemmataceae bacterium]